ncbi:MAG: YqaA family protein [Candidatus Anammoxibacter sp.]
MADENDVSVKSSKKVNFVRKIYDWTRGWAKTPYGIWALFVVAFCEASFFPVPPDVLLLVLAVARPKRSFVFALVCSIGSVLGGCLGYYLGSQFFEYIGMPILNFYGSMDKFESLSATFQDHGFMAIMVAGITPIPYKVFTIAAGFCKIDFSTLVLASIISRSLRFFAVAGLIFIFGGRIEKFIDKYFNLLSILFIILLVLGFVVIKLFH